MNSKVLTSHNVLGLAPHVAERYLQAYWNDSEMSEVDVAYCSYPASLCSLYLPLNKTVLVHASTRYPLALSQLEIINF